MRPMIEALGRALNRWFTRWMPDPFVLAFLLTLVVLALGLLIGDAFSPAASDPLSRLTVTLISWKDTIFGPKRADGTVIEGYLYFAFQMCVVLVTGHALATSRPVHRALAAVARLPRTAPQAVAVVAFAACALGLLHWGLGLIGGALVAREVGRQGRLRGIPLHYPLIGAAGYTGLLVWGGGLSGSIPLKAIDYRPPADLAAAYPLEGGIPKSLTLFSSLNFTVGALLLLAVPVIAWLLHPKDAAQCVPYHGPLEDEHEPEAAATTTRAPLVTWLEEGRSPAVLLAALGLTSIFVEVWRGTFRLDFNSLNLIFLFAGILAQGSLIRYVRAVSDGISGCAGIVLQFPFYFGILGILLATGLGGMVSRGIVSLSTPETYPIFTFFSAGLVNLFVPSGGGQWIVQGNIVIGGAGSDPHLIGKSVMALAYGDMWTNMLQPFWALPLLGITGLRARDIIGYSAAIMLITGVLIVSCLLVF